MIKIEDIQRFHDVLGEAELLDKVWLCGGLVLGYYRDGQPIGHDPDVDLAIMDADVRTFWDAVPIFERHGFRKLFRWVNGEGLICEYSFQWEGAKWEFFIHFQAGSLTWNGGPSTNIRTSA